MPAPVTEVDVAVIGAGGAGLSLVTHLDALLRAAPAGRRAPRIALVDPVRRAADDRTWCFWEGDRSLVVDVPRRSWPAVDLVEAAGAVHRLDLRPLRYVMVRSSDVYRRADLAVRRLGALRVPAAAEAVRDVPGGVLVRTTAGAVRARWAFDSRPSPPARPARTRWLQHFRGRVVRLPPGAPVPDVPVLMDFSADQPPDGVGFGYVIPFGGSRVLVEYTVFSAGLLPAGAYDRALTRYLAARWGRAARAAVVEEVESGVIPMTDAVHARRAGRRVFRLGTAGGATRASTGYTFAAMQRQAHAVAAALLDGRSPMPPPAYPARHRWMDAVLLRALDSGSVSAAELFTGLLTRLPPERVLRFLDGASGLREDLTVMNAGPRGRMAAAGVADARARLAGRLRPSGPSGAPGLAGAGVGSG